MPAYPSSVPVVPEISSFSIKHANAPVSSNMDGGNVRQRARAGDRVATIMQQIPMTREQWSTLKDFLITDVSLGTARFTMTVFDGETCQTGRTVQLIGGMPEVKKMGPKFIVPFNVRVYNLA